MSINVRAFVKILLFVNMLICGSLIFTYWIIDFVLPKSAVLVSRDLWGNYTLELFSLWGLVLPILFGILSSVLIALLVQKKRFIIYMLIIIAMLFSFFVVLLERGLKSVIDDNVNSQQKEIILNSEEEVFQ